MDPIEQHYLDITRRRFFGTCASGACGAMGTVALTRICFAEEMRWLEYVQRLATERRGVCVDDRGHCARALWQAATVNGARSLGIEAGQLKRGHVADLVALDLTAPTLAGWDEDTLLDSFLFGSGREAIAATCVGGRWVYER